MNDLQLLMEKDECVDCTSLHTSKSAPCRQGFTPVIARGHNPCEFAFEGVLQHQEDQQLLIIMSASLCTCTLNVARASPAFALCIAGQFWLARALSVHHVCARVLRSPMELSNFFITGLCMHDDCAVMCLHR